VPRQSVEMDGPERVHPSQTPSQQRWRPRIGNHFIYRTIRKAIRDCNVHGPILMAPCGYGWYFPCFRRDGIALVGLDISSQALQDARRADSPVPPLCQASILQLPFRDNQFEFILNNRFLLHFHEAFRIQALKELARVTQRYLLVHYDTMSLRQLLRRLRGMRKKDLELEKFKGWKKEKRRERRLLYDRALMVREGAAAGLVVKKLYYVSYLISDRVYCLYEKGGTPPPSGAG
jgi:hypothetical protein